MQKGTLYSMEEFKKKFMLDGEGKFEFIDRMFKDSGKSAVQLYRDLDKSNIRVFTSGKEIRVLLERKK